MPEATGDTNYISNRPEFWLKFPRLIKMRILKFAGLRFWRYNRCLLEYRVGDDPPVTRWMRVNDTINIDVNLRGWTTE